MISGKADKKYNLLTLTYLLCGPSFILFHCSEQLLTSRARIEELEKERQQLKEKAEASLTSLQARVVELENQVTNSPHCFVRSDLI
jgi:hypothetical protein